MKHDVLNRFTGKVQFTAEIDCEEDAALSIKLGLSVKWAIKNNVVIRSADLRWANLRSANLRSADFSWADLRSANLRSADFSWADFSSADLRSADLRWADFSWADFSSADLRSANLRSADFSWADLRSANFSSADFSSANFSSADFSSAKNAIVPITIGQVGNDIRTGFAIWTPEGIRVRLGCFDGTDKEALAAVKEKYGVDSGYYAMVKAACLVAKERGILNPTEDK